MRLQVEEGESVRFDMEIMVEEKQMLETELGEKNTFIREQEQKMTVLKNIKEDTQKGEQALQKQREDMERERETVI